MDKQRITFKIANRDYSLLIDSQEEEGIRAAAKAVNDRLKQYKANMNADDSYLLGMVAFDCMIEKLGSQGKALEVDQELAERASELSNLLHAALSQSPKEIRFLDPDL